MSAASALRQGRGTKRLRVLQEAARCLNGRGVSQTSLATIAAAMGISRAALYYYVADQQDLVFQCYRQSCEVMGRRLAAARRRSGGALEAVDAFIHGMLGDDDAEIAALSEIAYLRPEQRDTVLALHESLVGDLCDVLENGMRRGQVRPLESRIVAEAILGLVSWLPIARRWPTTVDVAPRSLIGAVKTICMEGVAGTRVRPSARGGGFAYEPLSLPVPSMPLRDLFDNEALAAAKHEALLAAASWHFNQKGIDATSLEEIALGMGVTPKVIYHNVGDKEALVTGCYRRAFRFYLALAERAGAYPGTRLQAICAVAHALAEAVLREDLAPLTPVAGFDSLPRHVQREVQDAASRLLAMHTALYRKAQAEGSIRRFDIRAVLSVRHAAHEWLPKWHSGAGAEERTRIARELADFTRLGLAPV